MAEVPMERSTLVDADALPNNSLVAKQKAEKAKEKKGNGKTPDSQKAIQPVAKGEVQKKPFGQRFLETVGVNDGRTVGDYLLWDVVIPATKDLISSVFKQGIDVFLYGQPRAKNVNRNGMTSRVSYGSYYDKGGSGQVQRRDYGYSPRAAFDFQEITYPDRQSAEMVLSEMVEIVDVYDFVRVSDFLTLSNVPAAQVHFTDHDMGWDMLGSVEVVPVHTPEGTRWALTLPKPMRR